MQPAYHLYVPPAYTSSVAVATWALAVLFCIWYTWDAVFFKVENPWWRTQMGNNMFILAATIALVLIPGVLFRVFKTNIFTAFWQWYSAIAFSLAAPVLLHRLCYGVYLRVKDLREIKKQQERSPQPHERSTPGPL